MNENNELYEYSKEIVVFSINHTWELNKEISQIIAHPDYTELGGADQHSLYYPSAVSDRMDYIVNMALKEKIFDQYKYVLIINGKSNISEKKIMKLYMILKKYQLDMVIPSVNGSNKILNEDLEFAIYANLQCFMIKVDVLKAVKGFDQKFCHRISPEVYLDPFYTKIPYVDIDFCLRLHKENYRFALANIVSISFYGGDIISKPTKQQISAGEDLIWYRHHLSISDINTYNQSGLAYAQLVKEKTIEYQEPLLESGYETGDDRPLILWHYSAFLQNFKKGSQLHCQFNILQNIFKLLYKKGYQIQFVREHLLDKACAIVFMDCPDDLLAVAYRIYEFPYYEKWISIIKAKHNSHKLILCTTAEPPMTTPIFYNKDRHYDFRFCLTQCKMFLDNKKYFYQPALINFPLSVFKEHSFSSKKLCTFVCGGFFRTVKDETCLYKKRLEIVKYFDQNHPADFDFWGMGWEGKDFQCYRGQVENRFEVFAEYKFVICIPNSSVYSNVFFDPRIFDAMVAGSIPIYLGCPDIKNIIPEDIFIDLRKFPTYNDLYDFISSMDERTYIGYIERIKRFLSTEEAQKYSMDNYVECLHTVIQKIDKNEMEMEF